MNAFVNDLLHYAVRATAIIVIMKIKLSAQTKKAMQSKTKATTGLVRYKRVSCFIGQN